MPLHDYFREFAGKRVALLGLARSNLPLIEPLHFVGAKLILCDENTEFQQLPQWRAMGCELYLGDGYLDGWDADVIIRTPGIRPDVGRLPEMVASGTIVTSEMELFMDRCPCMTYGVTGSDGKTTTTSIIATVVKQSGIKTWLGGNIGTPLLPQIDQIGSGDCAVLEISSFQLMGMKKSADIAVLTNISPNHLDWHIDYDEYKRAKETIFKWQTVEQTVVLNRDNYESYKLHDRAKGNVVTFSIDNDADITVKNGKLTAFNTEIMDIAGWKLPGRYNIENLLAAVGAVWGNVPTNFIAEAVESFKGVEHRLEWVSKCNGANFYNNSIATSPSRVIASLKAFDRKIILIAGGAEKGIGFDELAKVLPQYTKHVILTGNNAANSIETAAKLVFGCPPISRVDDMQQAVTLAAEIAGDGDIVALMPACTAFDAYRDFAERGEDFKRLVRELCSD